MEAKGNTNTTEHTEEKISITDRVVVYLICAMILCFGIAFFVTPKKEFSESENRTLAKAPEFTFENLKSGSFTDGIGTYAADHFPMRDRFLSIMTETERLSGRKEINGVYLAQDGSLIEVYDAPANTQKQIAQFTKLAENVENADCYLMLVPTAVSIYADKLPENAPDAEAQQFEGMRTAFPIKGISRLTQNKVICQIYAAMPKKMHTIYVTDLLHADAQWTLQAGGENAAARRLYYRTDHHWTTYGAYVGYQEFCMAAGFEPVALTDYTAEVVSEDFRGTIYSKLNDPYFGTDTIISYSDPDWKLTVEYSDTKEVTDTIYNPEYLSRKDQYSYFLNNIHPMITITNDAVSDGAIAVVKDSYANCFVPFLLNHYHTVYVFDTRYYKGGPSKFINEHPEITDVLILYNMNTIDNDTGIGGIY